jgi:hypothetical protein
MYKLLICILITGGFMLFGFGCASERTESLPEVIEEVGNGAEEAALEDFLTAGDVIDSFKTLSIPIGEVIVYDEETCPNDLLGRPGQYIGKADWEDTRVEQFGDSLTGGTVEVFDNQNALIKRKEYLEPFLEEAMFLQYMYVHKNVIVRIDKELTPTQADEYKDALESL